VTAYISQQTVAGSPYHATRQETTTADVKCTSTHQPAVTWREIIQTIQRTGTKRDDHSHAMNTKTVSTKLDNKSREMGYKPCLGIPCCDALVVMRRYRRSS
jgi:hypothetical protein